MSMSADVQAAIYGQARGSSQSWGPPGYGSRSIRSRATLYEFKFGNFHIYHDTR